MTAETTHAPTVTVSTPQGRVRGLRDGDVASFLGIPYAQAPTGPRRLLPPQPVASWAETLDATQYGPTVPQPPLPPEFSALYPAEPIVPGDGWLNLNVWTPDPAASGLPVIVWVHGGAFLTGTGAQAWYQGTSFARNGVVCVTINYRLGYEGFLAADGGTPNLGLLDQIAALAWVQENIESFGGDPAKVTLAGQSAGGMAVSCLLGSPLTSGLFRAAIPMAGGAHHTMPLSSGRMVAGFLAGLLGIEPTREAFAAIPPAAAVEAAQALGNELAAGADPGKWGEHIALSILPFMPSVDGEVLDRPPLEAIAAGRSAEIPVLTGCNRDEGRIFVVPTGFIDALDEPTLALLAQARGLDASRLEVYRDASPQASPGQLFGDVMTDWYFRIPAIRLAETKAAVNQAPAWMYEFTAASTSPRFGGRIGSVHAIDLPHLFNTIDQPSAKALIGPEPSQATADALQSTVIRFVTDLDPGWPPYGTGARATGTIGESVTVTDDPHSARRQAWDGIR